MTGKSRRYLLLGMICAVLSSSLPCGSSTPALSRNIVFRIGQFDRSSSEFSSATPTQLVNFVVSKSRPDRDWFSAQPALLAFAGKSEQAEVSRAPRSITFLIDGLPARSYELHIAVLVESASLPALRITINGKSGMFYLHPQLDYSNGDQWDSFDPAYSSADVDVVFSGKFLHTGTNSISLQAIEEAAEEVPDARLNYDAIELDSIAGIAAVTAPQVEILPTVFYRRQNGSLQEEVDAFIRHAAPISDGSRSKLMLAGHSYSAYLRASEDFGEQRIQFWVSEFPPRSQATLTFQDQGRRQHSTLEITPARRWTIYLVPHIHLDVGYSDYQAKVAAIQSRVIDEAMELSEQHPGFCFSLDGDWPLDQFLATRSDQEKQRVIEALRTKRIFLPAQYANLLTGIASGETLIRSLYPSARISREYGIPLDYANITDVPSYSWSYASILGSAGLPYFIAASDNYRAPVLLQGRLNEASPTWWVGPDGNKVLLWYSRSYLHMQMLFGLPPLISAGRDTLPLFLQAYDRPGYRANATILYGTQVENTDLFPQQAELAEKWNNIYTYPRLQYSGFHEALETIAQQFGDAVPSIRGDGGPYWEDGAASDAFYLALERRNEARAPSAEKLSTLASLLNPALSPNTEELSQMWTAMVLADEHTFDSWDSISDPESLEAIDQSRFKEQFATNAAAQVDLIARRSMANLADAIPAPPGSIIVFNSLNWARSGYVSIDLDKANEIVDLSTNHPVPYELIAKGNTVNRVRFQADNVPALGYKVFLMRPAKSLSSDLPASEGNTLENRFYKVQLDPETGSIRSIYDKELRRELVNQNGQFRFGEYLYVTGGDKNPNRILVYGNVNPEPELEVHPAHGGRLVSIQKTIDGEVARMESEDLNTPRITTEIRVFDGQKKIEFLEEVDKKEVVSKEAVYFAFPFALSQPRFQYEVQNGVVDPATDMYPGAGHEWFSVQHWISAEQNGLAGTVFPLDAPLVTLGDINRGQWPDSFGKRPGTIFSYVMNNYWNTNYRAGQGGHFSFRYVIISAASTNPEHLSQMGWEEATPLETDLVTSQDKAVNSSTSNQSSEATHSSESKVEGSSSQFPSAIQGRFMETADSGLLLETWKPAEDGDGTILRFLDFGGTKRSIAVQIPWLHLEHAWQADALERNQKVIPITEDGQLHFTIHPHEFLTIRIQGTLK